MSKKPDPLKKSDSRAQLERAALTLGSTTIPKHLRVECLGTLLSAYALGSRTAKRGLEDYERRIPGWSLPERDEAMAMANEAFQESETLRANYSEGDTLPGF